MAAPTAVTAVSLVRPASTQAPARNSRARRLPSYVHAASSTRPPAAAPATSEPRYAALVARLVEAATAVVAAAAGNLGTPIRLANAKATSMSSASQQAPSQRATARVDQPVTAATGLATTAVAT